MKLLFYLPAIALVLFSSCDKTTDLDNNYWTVNDRQLSAINVQRTPYTYLEVSTGSSYMRFYFHQFPTSNTSYHIVSAAQPPADGEISITATYNNLAWASTNRDTGAMINVVVDDEKGRLKIYTDDIWLNNLNNTDSIKVSAHITEF